MKTGELKNQNYWYAIYTKPRSEKKVFQRMLDHDMEAFLPLVKTVRQWSDRKKTVQVPLISSYVFVYMPEQDLAKTLPIPGTVNVLKHLGKPAKIRDVEIENLRILSGTGDKYEVEDCKRLIEGDVVEVEKGPFTGLIATCEKKCGNHRVIVKIDSLQSCVVVNVPLNYLRKIENKVLV